MLQPSVDRTGPSDSVLPKTSCAKGQITSDCLSVLDEIVSRPLQPNPNRRVRSEFTSAEREKFETRADLAPRNMLNFLNSYNLTKTAVVKLCRRKRPQRGPKWPETGLHFGLTGQNRNSPDKLRVSGRAWAFHNCR